MTAYQYLMGNNPVEKQEYCLLNLSFLITFSIDVLLFTQYFKRYPYHLTHYMQIIKLIIQL